MTEYNKLLMTGSAPSVGEEQMVPQNTKQALEAYMKSQNPLNEAFKQAYEGQLSRQQQQAQQVDEMKQKQFTGLKNTNLTPLMAFADYLNQGKSNLAGSYQAPIAEEQNRQERIALENYVRQNEDGAEKIGIQQAANNRDQSKEAYNFFRQLDNDQFSNQYKSAQAKLMGQGNQRKDVADIGKLRKEWTSAPTTKDTQGVSIAFEKVKASAMNPSAAGDISLLTGYMKMLDPGSTVREGEFATAQNAAGVPDRVLNMYNQALSGQRLNPDQRNDFINQAQNVYKAQLSQQNMLDDQYKSLAKGYGYNENEVVLDLFSKVDQAAPKPQAPNGLPKPGDIDGGMRFKGGDPSNPANWEAM